MRGFGDTNKSKKRNLSNIQFKFDHNQILNKAINYHYQGNILQAGKLYKVLIEKGSKNSTVFTNYGLILLSSGKLKDAEFFTRKAVELNPKDSIAHSNLGSILKDQEKIKDAEFFIRKAITLNPKDSIAHSNLGGILRDLRKLEEAELYTRKAIELNPKDSLAHFNLGGILIDLRKLEEAEKSLLKAIKLNPNFGKAYFLLSTFKKKNSQNKWEEYLFSKNIETNQNTINLIDLYFAKANILEKNFQYTKSANMFMKANKLNRKIYGSNYIQIIDKMKHYYKISQNIQRKKDMQDNQLSCIFIVGLPRSGKTITESILSQNELLVQCGENDALSKAVDKYLNPKMISKNHDLYQMYIENISKEISNKSYICSTTPGDYQFAGIIASQIANSKVIYCFRNPLDHIKEMFCSNLMNKFTFKTSIVESAKLLLLINELMENYKRIFNSKIYFLNYDKLVDHPEREIKSLLSWLGFKYKTEYLNPILDPTTLINSDNTNAVINTNYLNVWKRYKTLLQPAIEIISKNEKFKQLIF